MKDDAISKIQIKAWEISSQGFANIVRWDSIKQNPPSKLKISLLAMIPLKNRKYSAILNISFVLNMAGWVLPLVKKRQSKQYQMKRFGRWERLRLE